MSLFLFKRSHLYLSEEVLLQLFFLTLALYSHSLQFVASPLSYFMYKVSKQSVVVVFSQIQGSIHPHAIIILPNSAGTEVLVCYEDEGVYIDTYGRITKDTVLQWGEMPASVGKFHSYTHTHTQKHILLNTHEMTTNTKASFYTLPPDTKCH